MTRTWIGLLCLVLMGAAPTAAQPCAGDCDGDGEVTIDQVLTLVNIALGGGATSSCEAGDVDGDGSITIDEIVAAVSNALSGCQGPNVAGGWIEDRFMLTSSTCAAQVTDALRSGVQGLAACRTQITVTAPGQVAGVDCKGHAANGTVDERGLVTFAFPPQSATQSGCTITETDRLEVDAGQSPSVAHYTGTLSFAGTCSLQACTIGIESRWTREP